MCILACKDLSLNMRTIRQARSLARAGHRVTVVGSAVPDARLARGDKAVNLIATGTPRSSLLMMNGLWLRGGFLREDAALHRAAESAVAAGCSRGGLFARRVMNHLAGRSFHVVQAHFDRALLAASVLSRRNGAKLVFDAVEVPFDEEMLPRTRSARAVRLAEIRREAEIARHADGWITVNESLADAAVERFGVVRPMVLRNFQDKGRWASDGRLRSDIGVTREARILLHLNTMRRGEGIETAIDALAHLPAAFHLVALGPAPERGFLRSMRRRAEALGVAKRFHVAPLQPPHAIPAYIAGADIGIIAREGGLQNLRLSLPNRLFQMIAARLPVVATPLPEIARILRSWRLGLLFEQSDAASLAASVRKVIEPSALRRFKDAVDKAACALTWEEESVAYVRFIEQLAGGEPIRAPEMSGIAAL